MNRTGIVIACIAMLLLACSSEDSTQKTAVDADLANIPDTEEVTEPTEPAKMQIEPKSVAVVEKMQPIATALPAVDQNSGLALAKKSGCLNCHSVEKKIVGPAWRDVAKRYKGQAGARAQLIEKVKKGGSGNWTEVTGGTPMPANSPRVADADIETLVGFVLSLE